MTEPLADKRLPVDEDARRLARRLVRTASFASLGTLDPVGGGPLVTRVSTASDDEGHPLILVSDLSVHTAALVADGRCSLLLGEPTGERDTLRDARISVNGRAEFLHDPDTIARARSRFLSRHPQAALYIDFSDFHLVRIGVEKAYLNGGFARAFRLDGADVIDPPLDPELSAVLERARLHMNADHLETIAALADYAANDISAPRIVTIDARGFEIEGKAGLVRVEFERLLMSSHEVRPSFVALARGL